MQTGLSATKLGTWWETRTSLWFVPTAMTAFAIVLAAVMVDLDRRLMTDAPLAGFPDVHYQRRRSLLRPADHRRRHPLLDHDHRPPARFGQFTPRVLRNFAGDRSIRSFWASSSGPSPTRCSSCARSLGSRRRDFVRPVARGRGRNRASPGYGRVPDLLHPPHRRVGRRSSSTARRATPFSWSRSSRAGSDEATVVDYRSPSEVGTCRRSMPTSCSSWPRRDS